MSFNIKTCGLYKSMAVDGEEPNMLENFLKELAKLGVSIMNIESFYNVSSGTRPYRGIRHWTEEHFAYILHYPKILHDLSILNIEDFVSLIIGYGFWCEIKGHKLEYFDQTGEPILGGVIEEMIERRKCNDTELLVDDLIEGGYTITVLKRLSDTGHSRSGRWMRKMDEGEYENDSVYDSCPMNCAAWYGQMEMIKYFHDFGLEWSEDTVTLALSKNHLDIAKYLIEQGCPRYDEVLPTLVTRSFITVDTFEFIISIDNYDEDSFNNWTISKFITEHNVEVSRYLLNKGLRPKDMILILEHTPATAADPGNIFKLVELLHEYDIPWKRPSKTWDFLITVIEDFRHAVTDEELKAICQMGCPIHKDVLLHAIRYCGFDFIQYLHGLCPPLPTHRMLCAAMYRSNDRMEVMKLLKESRTNCITNCLQMLLEHYIDPARIVEVLEDLHDAGFTWDTEKLETILVQILERSRSEVSRLANEIEDSGHYTDYHSEYNFKVEQYIERETSRNFDRIMEFSRNRTPGPRTVRRERAVKCSCEGGHYGCTHYD
jgi:hypothetical protein